MLKTKGRPLELHGKEKDTMLSVFLDIYTGSSGWSRKCGIIILVRTELSIVFSKSASGQGFRFQEFKIKCLLFYFGTETFQSSEG